MTKIESDIIQSVILETGYSEARVKSELERTMNQVLMFANVIIQIRFLFDFEITTSK